ncbi:MAG TPA: NUDIX hydrolase [Methylomirabilota bacterium]|jgi:ADP-ribose pyrophosphatase|nr:NUDIX hydrolase [Methylomirabilota bacterium]
MDRTWHFLGSSTLQHLGKLTLREDAWRLPNGTERRYPVLHVGLTVGVVPFVDRDHVLLIRQFRHLAREASWELPGGGGQLGESPEAAAQRELREEGGHRAGRLTFLTRFYPSNAYLDETAHCFLGLDLTPDPLAADDDEFFERRVVPFREAVAMALDDRITESVSKVALLAAALRPELLP